MKGRSLGRGRVLPFAVLVVAGGLLGGACTTSPKALGGLELVITAEGLTAGKDFDDIKLDITQPSDGGVLWDRDYLVPSMEAPSLPTTFTLFAGQSPDEVSVVVTAYTGGSSGQAIVQRVAEVQVPTDQMELLYLVLAKACEGQVGTCSSGESCQPSTGTCGSNKVTGTLPTYVPGQSFDAGVISDDFGTSDATTDGSNRPDARKDSSVGEDAVRKDSTASDAPDEIPTNDAPEEPVRGESGPDSSACADTCTVNETQCVSGAVQTCLRSGGCAQWLTTATCGTNQTCTVTAEVASCTCNPSICTQAETVCQDNETVATCATEEVDDCLYVASTASCVGGMACQNGACACPSGTLNCGGTCAVTATDVSNCGSCAHSCQGGACSAGVCQPLTLAPSSAVGCTAPIQPFAIAVNETTVFWTESARVMAAPLNGGPCVTLASGSGVSEAVAIAATSTTAYYSNFLSGNVMSVPATGSSGPSVFATAPDGLGNPYGIALIGSTLYWADNGAEGIFSAPTATGIVSQVACGGESCPVDNYPPFNLAADSNNLYVGTFGSGVYQVPKGGGTAVPILAAYSNGNDSEFTGVIAVNATNVYWTTGPSNPGNSILTGPIGGGGVTTVVSGGAMIALAVDSAGLYWDNGNVVQTPATGGGLVTLAPNQVATLMTVDGTSVYWTNSTAGTVMKVAK